MRIRIFTFSLPAVAWGNEFVPILPLIGHKFKIVIENPYTKTEVEVFPNYQLDVVKPESELWLAKRNETRVMFRVNDVFLTYKRPPVVLEKQDWVLVDIPILQDTQTLKIVSVVTFQEIYKKFTGEVPPRKEMNQDIADFVIKRRIITPTMFVAFNSDPRLKQYLPYGLKVVKENGDNGR
jgi:hypothetical protein